MTKFGWLAAVAPVLFLACSSTNLGEQDPLPGQGGTGGNTSPPGQGGEGGTIPAQKPLPDAEKSPLAYDSAPSVDPGTASALVGDLNNFGLQVLQRLAPSDQNFVVSPASGFIALTMTSAGAQGTTANEMKAVLYPSVSLSEIHPATNQLEQRVRGYARPAVQTDDGEKKVELNLANDDFVQKGMVIEQPFLDTLAVNYNCGVQLVDYQSDPEAARTLINNWVANETNDCIQDLLPPGAVDSNTSFVLVNALYLYSSWLTAFDPRATRPWTFHGTNGDASTDFMGARLDLSYTTGAGWVGVDIPYYGDSLVFTAVLPDSGELDTVKAGLNADWFANFDNTAQSQEVGLSIPKFRLAGQTVSWRQTLLDLGMTTLFDPGTCDLEGISSAKPLFIANVLQQVYVAVAEKGTEAAAATGVLGSGAGPPPVSVVLDRPFLFFIRERGGPVLFAGQVVSLPVAS
jgi:serpin B